ncbi:MAG: hypothetical protein RLZZ225_872 [Pseudomonadota bacterium]|jgi:type IV secretion system protein VirB1
MDLVTLVLACSLYADNSITYAMVQTGTQNNPLVVTVDGTPQTFKSMPLAIRYTQRQIAEGKKVAIGLMQISSQWLPEIAARPSDLFRPCKNLVVATQILEKLRLQCQTIAANKPNTNIQACVLSLYKTKSPQNGLAYANQVMQYAKEHPFSVLAEKARDPGMLAATAKIQTKPNSLTQTLVENTNPAHLSSHGG